MKTKHTPGPWLIEAKTCHSGDIATVLNTADKWVTIYAPHWMETGKEPPENSANALLIAAAPDLLEALVGLLSHVEELAFIQGYTKGEIQAGKAFQPARAAIAKATGGAA